MRKGLGGPPPLLGLAEPGDSVLHRARAGAKLLGLVGVGTAVGVVRGVWPGPVAAVGLALLLLALAGLARGCRLRRGLLRAQVRRTWWVLLALAAVQWWSAGPWLAATVVAGLLGCLWAATLVTATTPVPALLDTVVRALRPLRRFGVDPERVGFAFTLTLTSIPVVSRLLAESREAAAARGLSGDPRALLVPTVVRAVAHAEQLGEALAARGLD
ncbi:energy-coupling factor transporter transmembrane component T [Kineococcus rhizosphaerae]|uniref:Biotin transport system permease protein n=1 Tax=Kineococcus rhizosphaerae TaxID=559628 RepID=A0A2T0R3P3_9ACTN|nr:energy-coupling factor transporter transmembrane component T [Kineococcus rhizosphaerae]PRY14677.1 biotin transport system permease protein [Kineococcus rhizosphaerae]